MGAQHGVYICALTLPSHGRGGSRKSRPGEAGEQEALHGSDVWWRPETTSTSTTPRTCTGTARRKGPAGQSVVYRANLARNQKPGAASGGAAMGQPLFYILYTRQRALTETAARTQVLPSIPALLSPVFFSLPLSKAERQGRLVAVPCFPPLPLPSSPSPPPTKLERGGNGVRQGDPPPERPMTEIG